MRHPLLVLAILAVPATATAHYNMLLPSQPFVDKDGQVKITYQFGHPYEHELFDAPLPQSLVVLRPDGEKKDLLASLKKVSVEAGEKKKVAAYELAFKPDVIGDYVFVLRTPPIWMQAEGVYFQDTVKVVLHVQAQKGWDAAEKADFELVPLTRPYGLLPGTVFQAQIKDELPRKLGGTAVEIERYNDKPPAKLPLDEFITRVVKTDPNGVVTCNLPEAGWWCLTAVRDGGTKDHDGKLVPVRQRSTFWLYVHDKAPDQP